MSRPKANVSKGKESSSSEQEKEALRSQEPRAEGEGGQGPFSGMSVSTGRKKEDK